MTTTSEKTEIKYTYGYDDEGVRCRHSDEGGWDPVEEYCINCGKGPGYCECGQYRCGRWFCEEIDEWKDADADPDDDE